MDMDVRSLLVLLTLFLETFISLKGAQASTEECTVPDRSALVEPDDENVQMLCTIGGTPQWTIGNDLCDPSSFTDYMCRGSLCHVARSDYMVEGPTFACCHQEEQRYCYEIKIRPETTHQVPPVMLVGRTETLYTIITSKPRPEETPEVKVKLFVNSSSSFLNASTVLVSDPTDPIKYVAIHTFDVPSDIDTMASIRLEFTQPPEWRSLDLLASSVPIVTAYTQVPRLCTVSEGDPSPETMESSTEGEEDTSATFTCRGPGVIAAAALAAVCTIVTLVLITVAICFTCWLLKKKQKEKLSRTHDCVPSAVTPRTLPLPPVDPSSTPGLTPTPMSADLSTYRLLPWPTAGSTSVVTDPAANGTTNPSFQRQQSRDSNSTTTTTTPTDSDRLLSVPAPVAASASNSTGSTGLGGSIGTRYSSGDGSVVYVVEPVRAGMMSQNCSGYPNDGRTGSVGDTASMEYRQSSSANSVESTQGGGSSNDPRYHSHTYASLLEVQRPGSASLGTAGGQSLTTGVGGGSTGGILTCTYNGGQLPQLSEMSNHHSSVPAPSLSTTQPGSVGTSSLISPPPPPTDPNYSTGGRKMHLHPQYCEESNTTDV